MASREVWAIRAVPREPSNCYMGGEQWDLVWTADVTADCLDQYVRLLRQQTDIVSWEIKRRRR